jgi:pimeloyl-ACP methyl ester carboxylesterase
MTNRKTRRTFLKVSALAASELAMASTRLHAGAGQANPSPQMQQVETADLSIGCEDNGPRTGFPIILLHGFPDDARAFDRVVPPLTAAGYRVLVPYLRGYGPTRFHSASSPRTGEQAAIGQDVIDLADALKLPRFAVGGYDWGGRAAAITAALHADRVRAAVLIGGYTIQNPTAPPQPGPPEAEQRAWYQWYFNTERGRAGLQMNRHALCKYLWKTWSPTWSFSDATYDRTAASFDNPDFVDVVIHSYRHRINNAPGDPRFLAMETQLSKRPPLQCPTITLYGTDDGVAGGASATVSAGERATLPALVAKRVIAGVGHFMPRERPDLVSSAMLELLSATK